MKFKNAASAAMALAMVFGGTAPVFAEEEGAVDTGTTAEEGVSATEEAAPEVVEDTGAKEEPKSGSERVEMLKEEQTLYENAYFAYIGNIQAKEAVKEQAEEIVEKDYVIPEDAKIVVLGMSAADFVVDIDGKIEERITIKDGNYKVMIDGYEEGAAYAFFSPDAVKEGETLYAIMEVHPETNYGTNGLTAEEHQAMVDGTTYKIAEVKVEKDENGNLYVTLPVEKSLSISENEFDGNAYVSKYTTGYVTYVKFTVTQEDGTEKTIVLEKKIAESMDNGGSTDNGVKVSPDTAV